MTEQDKLIQAAIDFGNKHSLMRLKFETLNFDYDFKREQDGHFSLVRERAVIKVLGHTTKVPIGEGCEHATYESAFRAIKKYWSAYYRDIRLSRSPEQKAKEVARQKRYRERRKKETAEFKRQQ